MGDMGMLNGQQIDSNTNANANGGFPTHQYLESDMEATRTTPTDLSNIVHLKRSEAYFMSDELRSEILRRNLLAILMPTQELAIRMFFFFGKK
jgi:hypothetical protein